MRSEDVFAAAKTINNRFLLCRVASVSAHRLHAGHGPYTERISKSLKLIAAMVPAPRTPRHLEELQINGDYRFLTPPRGLKSKPLGGHPIFEPLLEPVPVG
jgi:hypothetical protein